MAPTVKVIFLDCDGVVNRAGFDGDHRYFTPECFLQLQRIVSETKAKIVLSTSWREFMDWENMLRDFLGAIGIEVIGKTHVMDRMPHEGHDNVRAHEIQRYIDEHRSEFGNYVVIDDIDLREYFPGHCVCTCSRRRIGLDAQWADAAIAILNETT